MPRVRNVYLTYVEVMAKCHRILVEQHIAPSYFRGGLRKLSPACRGLGMPVGGFKISLIIAF